MKQMRSLSERELLRLARLFDHAALEEVYDRYNDAVYYYSLRRLGDPSLAEDCAADVFSGLLRALRDGGGPHDSIKSYLFRSAHNWIVDQYRRKPPLPLDAQIDMPTAESDPATHAEQNMAIASVRNALRLLTPDQQQVVVLRFIEGWELDDIAQCMQKPLGAVKALQHRSVAALRKMLMGAEARSYELQY